MILTVLVFAVLTGEPAAVCAASIHLYEDETCNHGAPAGL